MYIEQIDFKVNCPIAYTAWQLGTYHLHAHKGVIEVLMIIDGKAHVKSSFEDFDMVEGDYIVIREEDPHSISAADSHCSVVSLYFNMNEYEKLIAHLKYIYFACESFDLAKYRNETTFLRKMISSILIGLIRGDNESIDNAKNEAQSLIWTIAHNYDMIKYYNRNWDESYQKIEKYYKIMK